MIGAIRGVAIDPQRCNQGCRCRRIEEGYDDDASSRGRGGGAEDVQGRGLSYGDPDKFASSPRREEPAGERQPRQVFRAAVQYRGGTRLQAGTGRLPHGGPGARRASARMLSGGDTCLRHDRRAERGHGGRPSHAAGQCHPADRKPPATEPGSPRSAHSRTEMIDSFEPAPTGVPET